MSRGLSSIFGVLLGVAIGCLSICVADSPTHATANDDKANVELVNAGLVINLVQVGDMQSASYELIQLYNNSPVPVDVSNWCVYYASASTLTIGTKLACFTPSQSLRHIFVPTHGYITLASKQLLVAVPAMVTDGSFSPTLSGTSGHIRIVDSTGGEVDKLAWGVTAVSPDGLPAEAPAAGKVLVRTFSNQQYADTNNNAADFSQGAAPTTLGAGQLYDVDDLCGNIDDIQTEVPMGMLVDDMAHCAAPVTDYCPNILGVQAAIPTGYESHGDGLCWIHVDGIVITEILPNPIGADAGSEFIELYNPTDQPIALMNYLVKVGQNLEATIKFTHGETIAPDSYLVLKNDTYTFTLLNSSSLVALQTTDGQMVDQILPYSDPSDGLSWVMLNVQWQYTNRPTPGAANLPSFDSVDSGVVSMGVALAPCAANQYRNPATGRCKLLTGQSSALVPCKANQYRSLETGRCRLIATVTATANKPCPAGQARNAETNRCRKVVSTTPPPQDYAVIKASSISGNHNYALWTVVGMVVLGIAYAVWEWHQEISKSFSWARSFILPQK